jgi:cytosol alanyl aminopeptidase
MRMFLSALAFVAGVCTPSIPLLAADSPKIARLSDTVVPTRYGLDLTILPDQARFSGEARIDVMLTRPTSEIIMHAQNMNVKNVSVRIGTAVINGTLKETDKSGTARLKLSREAPAGKALILVRYDAPFNDGLDGLYKVVEGKNNYAFTQFETIQARKAFPSFDEPRFKTPYDVRITVRDDEVAISNAPERKTEKLGGGLKRITFATSKPLPTYLIAFAVGDLDVVKGPDIPATALRPQVLQLRGIAAKGKGGQFKYALDNTIPLLLSLEEYFGVPYPYEKLDLLAVPDFGFGAMENAGAIVYREQLLLMNEQSPLRQKRSYGAVHAHEMAHQWFGNLVTPAWWDDIWLNEAFASWMEAKPTMQWKPDWQFDLDIQREAYAAMKTDAKLSTRKIREPILTEDDIANAFDGITYNKGAGVLNMVENYAGRENFRKGVQLHMKRYPYGNATSDQFYASLADGAGQPELVEALKSFTDQPGVPVVAASLACSRKGATLSLAQVRYTTLGVTPPQQTWKIPMTITLDSRGKKKQIKTLLDTPTKTIALPNCPDTIIPDSGGFGYYHWTVSTDQWTKLINSAAKMPTADALALSSNLDAGFAAGTVDAPQIFAAAKAFSAHPASIISTSMASRLAWLHRNAPDAATRQKIEAFTQKTYAPLLAEIGLEAKSPLDASNPPEAELRRARLVDLLASVGRDKALRTELVARARAGLASAKPGDTAGLPKNIYDLSLAILAEDDPTATDTLLAKFRKSTEGRERGVLLSALAQVTDQQQSEKVRALMKEKSTRGNEIEQLLYTRSGTPETAASGWAWLKQDIETVMNQLADDRRSGLPFAAEDFCSAPERADVIAFFTPARLDKMRGATRSLAQTLDQIDQCIALKDRHMKSVTAYFGAK